MDDDFHYKGVHLVRTCYACPEQYDAMMDGRKVGYFRLRHGYFTVDAGDIEVYEAEPKGDGIFEYEEREGFLRAGIDAILDAIK